MDHNERFRTSILILGKTGVGKSSLLNYLFGENREKVATGRPVTGQGIYRHDGFPYRNIDIDIYDSWGLEPAKAKAWKGLIEKEVRNNGAKDIKDWFHTIIYCVDAQRSRLEDFEVTDILTPLENMGNRIMFVLTKCDLASEMQKKGIREELKKRFPERLCMEVGSVSVKLRSGRITEQFGREAVFENAVLNLGVNLFCKSLKRYKEDLDEYLSYARRDVLSYFEDQAGPIGLFTMYDEEFKNKIIKKAKSIYQNLIHFPKKELDKHIIFVGKAIKEVQKAYDLEKRNIDLNYIAPTSFKIEGWDNDFWEYVGGILRLGRKGHYRELVEKMCEKACEELTKSHERLIAHFEKRVLEQLKKSITQRAQ